MKRKHFSWLIIATFVLSAILPGCTSDQRIPEPERNPLVLSAEAQTVPFRVKYLTRLSSLGTGKVEDETNDIGNSIKQILTADDWLTVVYDLRQGNDDIQQLSITVTENESSEPRSATFHLCTFIKSTALTVTQEGKK